ncbi:ATP-binding cassette domain-containing protein [Kiloniella laminariae]|uniref:ATP-binding cassette domain-containing protein n=1 Tax=Kiloniella laminariae TaxID=454162 RepID=A0ABT4LMA2_9PROT|nr:oligopeptide/dipeptide ABC transporter ATP-binding protein [Kiloniella laminariae]MCZ4281506.1 ATP-binding cassette domain-containing protein [Kiloniella laminariae]
MNALEVKDLTKTFEVGKTLFSRGLGVKAVRRMSFEVRDGETLGIVGESGCGKSTLARMLVGLLPSTEGEIKIEGKVQDKASPREFGQMIQYVFQDPISSLNPRKTIRQIMETPLKRLHGMGKAERDKRISEIFASVNLREEFLSRYPHEFSGGQAQRIGIARALAAAARILILDEPVSALDVSVQAQVLNLLADLKLKFGLTYLFISHDLAVVEAVSDRVMVLYFGTIVEVGPADAIFKQAKHPYTKLLANSAPVVGRPLEAPKQKGDELPDPLNPPSGCPFAKRCIYATEICETIDPALMEMGEGHFAACHNPIRG